MAQTNLNIRMDEQLKKDFDALCADIGMSMTTAFTIFAKKAVTERRIPFELTSNSDPFYSSENLAILEKRIASIKSGESTLKEHDLIDED